MNRDKYIDVDRKRVPRGNFDGIIDEVPRKEVTNILNAWKWGTAPEPSGIPYDSLKDRS